MERFTTEEDCKRLGLRPVEPSPYPVHMPIPAPQQLGKLGPGRIRVVCHACNQYDGVLWPMCGTSLNLFRLSAFVCALVTSN